MLLFFHFDEAGLWDCVFNSLFSSGHSNESVLMELITGLNISQCVRICQNSSSRTLE